MAFSLTPALNPLVVEITFDVNITPYIEKWYVENKLPTETPSEFLKRMIGPSVIDYAASRELNTFKTQYEAALATNRAEASAVKQANGF